MAAVKNKLERDAMGSRKSKQLLLQVSWIKDDDSSEQDCGKWYGKKKD